MKIVDSIYGEFIIEVVLGELISTKAVQRLKGVHQGGASYLVNSKWNVKRYEHSIGVMLFIRFIGGSIEEQIAGLLHDISHTAFSHVIDFALKNNNENYHEEIYEKIIEESDIPKILLKHGYDYKDILFNESKWAILEKTAPSLCADRIDYTLRDMYHYGYISKEEVSNFISTLALRDGEIIIKSVKAAEWFVDIYYKEVIGFFMNPLNVYAYDKLSEALSISLELEEITLDDLLKTDDDLYKLLKSSKSQVVIELVELLNENVDVVEDKLNFDIYQKQKLRIIDPMIYIDGKISRVSERSDLVKKLTEDAIRKSNEGIFVRVIKSNEEIRI